MTATRTHFKSLSQLQNLTASSYVGPEGRRIWLPDCSQGSCSTVQGARSSGEPKIPEQHLVVALWESGFWSSMWSLVATSNARCTNFLAKGNWSKQATNSQVNQLGSSWSVCKVKWTGFSTKHTWLCWMLGHSQWGILLWNIQRWLFAEMLLASQGCSALWLQSPRFAPGLIRSFCPFLCLLPYKGDLHTIIYHWHDHFHHQTPYM